MNIIALPDGKPLYGGTYHAKIEWMEVLTQINSLYKKDHGKAQQYANSVSEGIQEVNLISPQSEVGPLDKKILKESVTNWKPKWDKEW